jgi:hypothetical protein
MSGTFYRGGRRFEASDYYELPRARVEEISQAGVHNYAAVARICLAQDWAEGAEHQKWLEEAPAAEIASWVNAILAEERTAAP